MKSPVSPARPRLRRLSIGGAAVLTGIALAGAASQVRAQAPLAGEQTLSNGAQPANRFWQRDYLTGDWGGVRERLSESGVDLTFAYAAEGFFNASGGRRRGGAYGGLLELGLEVNLEKLVRWRGATFHAGTIYPHGPNFTARYAGDFKGVSNIAAYDVFSLYEVWLQQELLDGRISLRIGQLAADEEFVVPHAGELFLNSDFGTPTALLANMPVPAYPVPGPGVRLKVEPWKGMYLLLGAFDGNPGPATLGDFSPDAAITNEFNRHGTHWALRRDEGAVLAAEVGWIRNELEEEAEEAPKTVKPRRGLFGAFKAGVFYHTDSFADVRALTLSNLGSSLAPEAVGGKEGNYAVYFSADQEVYREPGSETQGLTLFVRKTFAPAGRSVIENTIAGGFRYIGLIPSRDDDAFGLGVTHSTVSRRVRSAFREANRADGTSFVVPDHETVIELTYRFQLSPFLTLQPDLQYVIHPGTSGQLDNALVFGVRSTIVF